MFLHVQGWKLEHTKYVINLSCFSLFFICFSPGLYLSNVSNILKGPNWYDNFRCWTYERKDKKKVNPFRSSLHYKIWQSYRRDIYATFTQHLRATFTRHLRDIYTSSISSLTMQDIFSCLGIIVHQKGFFQRIVDSYLR